MGVESLPDCDFCRIVKEKAKYYGETRQGPWCYMCQAHFDMYGTGKVQELKEANGEGHPWLPS